LLRISPKTALRDGERYPLFESNLALPMFPNDDEPDDPLLIVDGADIDEPDEDEPELDDEPDEDDLSPPLLAEPIPWPATADAVTNNSPNIIVVERM
jgi:hypothetical protein